MSDMEEPPKPDEKTELPDSGSGEVGEDSNHNAANKDSDHDSLSDLYDTDDDEENSVPAIEIDQKVDEKTAPDSKKSSNLLQPMVVHRGRLYRRATIETDVHMRKSRRLEGNLPPIKPAVSDSDIILRLKRISADLENIVNTTHTYSDEELVVLYKTREYLDKEFVALHAYKGAGLMGLLRAALRPFSEAMSEIYTYNIFSIGEDGAIFRYRAWKEVTMSHRMRPYMFRVGPAFRHFLLSPRRDDENNRDIIILPTIPRTRIEAILAASDDREQDRETFLKAVRSLPKGDSYDLMLTHYLEEYCEPLRAAGNVFRKDRESWYRHVVQNIRRVVKSSSLEENGNVEPKKEDKQSQEQVLTELVDAGDQIASYVIDGNTDLVQLSEQVWSETADALLDRLIKRLASKVTLRQPPLPPIDYKECEFLTPYASHLGSEVFINPALRVIVKSNHHFSIGSSAVFYNYGYLAEEERLAHQTDRANITINAPFIFTLTERTRLPPNKYSNGQLYTQAITKIEYFTNGLSKILDLDKSYITGSSIAVAFSHRGGFIDFSDRLHALSDIYTNRCVKYLPVRSLAAIVAGYAVCWNITHEIGCQCFNPAVENGAKKYAIKSFIDRVYPTYYVTNSPFELREHIRPTEKVSRRMSVQTTHVEPLSAKVILTVRYDSSKKEKSQAFESRKAIMDKLKAMNDAFAHTRTGNNRIFELRLQLKRGADIDIIVDAADAKEFDQIAMDHYSKVKTIWPDATIARENKPFGGHMWNIDNPTGSATFRAIQIYRGNILTPLSHHLPPVRGCYGGPADKTGKRPFTVAASLLLCHTNLGVYGEPNFFASHKFLSQDILAKYRARYYTLGSISGHGSAAHPVCLMMERFHERSDRVPQWYATISNITAMIANAEFE